MKYAIKIASLPPCVIYVESVRSPGAMIGRLIEFNKVGGLYKLTHKFLTWLANSQFDINIKLDDSDDCIVFTDIPDVDIYIIKLPDGWSANLLTSEAKTTWPQTKSFYANG